MKESEAKNDPYFYFSIFGDYGQRIIDFLSYPP